MTPSEAYAHWLQATEKYDYFIAGLAAALAGYVGQNLPPVRLGLNAGTVETLAVACFIASLVCAAKRIETTAHLLRLQSEGITLAEEQRQTEGDTIVIDAKTREPLSPVVVAERLQKLRDLREALERVTGRVKPRVSSLATARDLLLVAGLLVLVLARVWSGYAPYNPP